ncbi:MAG: hypothetical protein JNJ77_18815 [Planctomycetia bacterium]|nr:hypothetical protein [Planctomycetia bacterium]
MTPRRQRLLEREQRRQFVWSIVARLFWLFLFLVHLYPVWVVSARFFQNPSFSNMVSLGVLYGILTLSALKTLDVAWLRIPLNRRSWLGLLLVAMWIHGDFVVKQLPDALTVESSIVVVTGVLAAGGRFIRHVLQRTASRISRIIQTFNSYLAEVLLPRPVHVILPVVAPRAPPVR